MKNYDIIAIGSGTASNLIKKLLQKDKKLKIAMIEKDDLGGICILRGCVPSKLLLHPADFIRMLERGADFGVEVAQKKVDFKKIMNRMRKLVQLLVENKKEFLLNHSQIDYYNGIAEFVEPYVVKVNDVIMKGKKIFLTLGSEPSIPPIKGLDEINFHTNKTILSINEPPDSIIFIGGGFIAAEYGHFFSSMGSNVTIIGRNRQFLPQEEIEISNMAENELRKNMEIYTNHEVVEVKKGKDSKKIVIAKDRASKEELVLETSEIFIASGRSSNSDLLKPENGGIETDRDGWIQTNEFLETSKENVWSFGDANGKYQLKHVAYFERDIVYNNIVNEEKRKVEYSAVPHAVYTYPKIAAVGLKQDEAEAKYGKENILIGFREYSKTIKGMAIGLEDSDFFVKIILEKRTKKILGAHIIGPEADVLIQELINLMYTKEKNIDPIINGMYIHPSLPEVVEQAIKNTYTVNEYQNEYRTL